MPTVRPLPDRPNLDFVRKESKSLLRLLQAGDARALGRAHAAHPPLRSTPFSQLQLADAQLIIAREYGFTSWPRLIHYFGDVARQQHAHVQLHGGRNAMEAEVRQLLAAHGRGSAWAARSLAAYVPRFFGLRSEDVLASAVREADARLAVARMHAAPSWEVLLERVSWNERTQPGDWQVDPIPGAATAMRNLDLATLERITQSHPELLRPSEFDISTGRTLMWLALGAERKLGRAAVQPVMDWLSARGFDRHRELNLRLCGHVRMTVEEVRRLLDQGADPNWVAPNGIPVLEHALLRYWNGEAVDVLAEHAIARKALWIAAGLGDVKGVSRYLDSAGKPTAEARRMRPDFVAVGARGFMPALPDADDEELLLEVLIVAMLNNRTQVIDYLAARGAPIDSMLYGSPLIHIAVGNAMTAVVECLLRHGADLELRGSSPELSSRELARYMFEQAPHDTERKRIAVLCGVNVESVLATPAAPPVIDSLLAQAMRFAQQDAARRKQHHVETDNLLIGLLGAGGPPLHALKEAGRMDAERFYDDLRDRLTKDNTSETGSELPMSSSAQTVLERAVAHATRKRRSEVTGLHVLLELLTDEDDPAAQLLRRYNVNPAHLASQLSRGL